MTSDFSISHEVELDVLAWQAGLTHLGKLAAEVIRRQGHEQPYGDATNELDVIVDGREERLRLVRYAHKKGFEYTIHIALPDPAHKPMFAFRDFDNEKIAVISDPAGPKTPDEVRDAICDRLFAFITAKPEASTLEP